MALNCGSQPAEDVNGALPSMAEVGHREGQWLSSLLAEGETSQQAPGCCQALIEVYSVT